MEELANSHVFTVIAGLASIISLAISLFIANKVIKISRHDSQIIKHQTQKQSGSNNQQSGRDSQG